MTEAFCSFQIYVHSCRHNNIAEIQVKRCCEVYIPRAMNCAAHMPNQGLNSRTIARSKFVEQTDQMARFSASLLMLLGLIIVVAATEELEGGKILFVTDVIKY